MLECKDKEQAVFYLYRLYGLQDVDPRVLRPPAEVETLHTKGRKSHKRAKASVDVENGDVANAEGEGDGKDDGGMGIGAVMDEDADYGADTAEEKADTGDSKKADNINKAMQEIVHEAEEHAVPDEEVIVTNDVVEKGGGELDCGSGDEEIGVEGERVVSKTKKGRGQKERKR